MEETGHNPRRERTKKMKLKGTNKKNKKCNRRTEELQKKKRRRHIPWEKNIYAEMIQRW
jgi:hypothetical protein